MSQESIRSGIYNGRFYLVDLSMVKPISIENVKDYYNVIYGISGMWTDISVDSSIYIGSCKDLKKRIFYDHFRELAKKEHSNCHLQHAYDKHGNDAFSIYILEEYAVGQRFEREQCWLDFYNDAHAHKPLFNIAKEVLTPPRYCDQINKKELHLRGKKYVVTHPDGTEEKIQNLSLFCRKYGLESTNLNAVAIGKIGQSQGFKARFADESSHRFTPKEIGKKWIITFPDGEEKIIVSLTNFCKSHGLWQQNMLKVAKGKISHTQGYKCRFITDKHQRYQKKNNPAYANNAEKYSKEYIVTHPNGIEERIRGIKQFCRKHGLSSSSMINVCSGKIKQHRGYKCVRI